jgi:hypothetical protein
MTLKTGKELKLQKYTSLTSDEILRLVVAVAFDVAEYVFPVLLAPITGDILDIAGVGLGIFFFGWYGLISTLEFLPFVDYFPVFILTWFIWYYVKKEKEKEHTEKIKKQWK